MAFRYYGSIEEGIKKAAEELVADMADAAPYDTGELADGISYKVITDNTGFDVEFYMPEYGIYQDKGVSGTYQKYNTPFSFTSKGPPPSVLDKWIVRNGLAPRSGGKFTERKGFAIYLSRRIRTYGIKPKKWLDKVDFDKRVDEMATGAIEDIWDAFSDDFNKNNRR